jgi:RNA polymerase sigma factor (sigma-70 family)
VRALAARARLRAPCDVEYEDLYQTGFVHLVLAAREFDAGRGARFQTWATWKIRGGIQDHLRSLGLGQHRGLEGAREQSDGWSARGLGFACHRGLDGAREEEGLHLRWSAGTRGAVRDAVLLLPASQQRLLAVLYGQQMTSREAARQLGCTWTSVEAQHRAVILRLRKLLEPLICDGGWETERREAVKEEDANACPVRARDSVGRSRHDAARRPLR